MAALETMKSQINGAEAAEMQTIQEVKQYGSYAR